MFWRKNKKTQEQGRARQARYEGRPGPAFSYYANRPTEVTPRRSEQRQMGQVGQPPKPRRFIVRWTQIPMWLLGVLVLVSAAKLLLLDTTPRVVIVGASAVTKSYQQSTATYAQAAHRLLASSITNRTKLTVNVNGTARALEQAYPELQNVSVVLPLMGNHPIVYLQVAQPSVVLQTGGSSYAVSASGVVLAKLKTVPAGAPTLNDQSNIQVKTGEKALPGSTVGFIQMLVTQFAAAKVNVSTYVLPAAAPFEVDVRLDGKPFVIRCNLGGEAREQSGAAIAALDQLDSNTPGSYLDVRVPGRVYYK